MKNIAMMDRLLKRERFAFGDLYPDGGAPAIISLIRRIKVVRWTLSGAGALFMAGMLGIAMWDVSMVDYPYQMSRRDELLWCLHLLMGMTVFAVLTGLNIPERLPNRRLRKVAARAESATREINMAIGTAFGKKTLRRLKELQSRKGGGIRLQDVDDILFHHAATYGHRSSNPDNPSLNHRNLKYLYDIAQDIIEVPPYKELFKDTFCLKL